MRFGAYLKSTWPAVALAALSIALCAFVLMVGGVNAALTALVALVIMAAWLAFLVIDYARKRLFYSELARGGEDVTSSLWMVDFVDEPEYIEGKLAFDALRAVSKAANDDIAEYRRQVADYREYVETWVHEAKSPLAASRLMLDNLAESVPDTDAGDVARGKVEGLGEEIARVEGYIDQALFFARSESLDRDYLIRSYLLKDLVGEAIKANARAMIAAHVAPLRKDLDVTVFTDEKWLVFMLGQLIQNSIKYAPENGAEISFSGCLVDRGLANERIELTVRDNGCGVPAEDLPRVFDRGFTGSNGRTGKRSTGIGLYLVKRLCDKMGLAVRAESVEGEFFAVTIGFSTNKMHYFE